jgi:hypothetical protein
MCSRWLCTWSKKTNSPVRTWIAFSWRERKEKTRHLRYFHRKNSL